MYDLNFFTQMDQMGENSAEIEQFVQESQDNFMQEDPGSEIPHNESSEVMSQGYGTAQMNDCVNMFFGSNVNVSKVTHGSSQFGSHRPGTSRFSSLQGSKTSTLFGMKDGSIGEGGLSIKNYIDSSRDLTMVQAGHATAFAAHLRSDGNMSGYSSAIGSKAMASGLMSTVAKGKDAGAAAGPGARVSKKKKEFEIAKDKILGHLDLSKELNPGSCKLVKNLN